MRDSDHTTSSRGARRGNLVIGQSGGATAVINASLVGAMREALRVEVITGIYGTRHGVLGLLQEDLLDLGQEPEATWTGLLSTPSAALGTCRYRLQSGDPERIVEQLRRLGVRYLVYIGGNDSAETAHRLVQAAAAAEYDLQVVCVPKTIDNDLAGTDHCPGYGSAARFMALATMDSARCTAAIPTHYPVKVIEVMGRNAGWLAAASALGQEREEDAPHLIYVPERPVSPVRFLEAVQRVHQAIGYVVVVVAETVRDERGQPLGALGQQGVDAFGHPLVSSAGHILAGMVRAELGLRTRVESPGDLQRMSSTCVSVADRDEAYMAGQAAVRAAVAGMTDTMVTLMRAPGPMYRCDTGLVELERVANEERLLPDAYLDAAGTGVTPAFREYALPLIGDPLPLRVRLKAMPVTG
jgi:ATP-dependent phosphofructokinase / diphosphate-dependent phosphofructokinase